MWVIIYKIRMKIFFYKISNLRGVDEFLTPLIIHVQKVILIGVLFVFAMGSISVKAQIVSTVAGNGYIGFSGDGGPATSAELYSPNCVIFDASGNYYIADEQNNRIRKVTISTGIISTVAGNSYISSGTYGGYSGDGGQATDAELDWPRTLTLDPSGNLIITDDNNNVIRKVVTSTGIITTIAGMGGVWGYSGDGGPATDAELWDPHGIATDASGNIYIADTDNNVVRKVSPSGTITTFAGTGWGGYGGDGGPATAAGLNSPYDLAVDPSGNVFISDQYNNRIREVTASDENIKTVGGNGALGYSGDGGPATNAELYRPDFISIGATGNIYISDTYNQRVRKISYPSGTITTIVGDGITGFSGDGGPALSAEFHYPDGIVIDSHGNMYIPDWGNQRIREVTGVDIPEDSTTTVKVTPPSSCDTCIGGLNLVPGKTYLVSIWAKDSAEPPADTSYIHPELIINFPTVASFGPYYPQGRIIDGWQRIEAQFTVPMTATVFNIDLTCGNGACNFDDLRVFPFNGTLKTYVYDPITLRLMAVLDERNYATIYEYDDEGKLIRVKKETERGVMTIQESRTSMHKL